MSKRVAFITFSAFFLLVLCTLAYKAYADDRIVTESTLPYTITAKLSPGWNLGDYFDAPANDAQDEIDWMGFRVNKSLFDSLASVGFKSVRIPITWIGHFGPAPDYKINPIFLERVRNVVESAEDAGLNVIINIHHDGALKRKGCWLNIKEAVNDECNEQIKAQFSALWRQIAEAFNDKGDFLIFEPFNEVQDGTWGKNLSDDDKQFEILNEWNQLFVDVVRSTGGNNAQRFLSVVGYGAAINQTINNLVLPNDVLNDKLLVTVHYYVPDEFTLLAKDRSWGCKRSSNLEKKTYDESFVRKIMASLKEKFIDNNIPVYIGEFGCTFTGDPDTEQFRKYYLDCVSKSATENGMACFLWDNGKTLPGKECHPYFDRRDGGWVYNGSEMVRTVVMSVNSRD